MFTQIMPDRPLAPNIKIILHNYLFDRHSFSQLWVYLLHLYLSLCPFTLRSNTGSGRKESELEVINGKTGFEVQTRFLVGDRPRSAIAFCGHWIKTPL